MTENRGTVRDPGVDAALGWVALALAAIAVVVFGTALRKTWPYTVDDAFIWFRYAQNLAAGHGITFNPHGPRAEGYTGFLWLWVMAIPHWLRWDPVLFSKCVGAALGVGSFALTFRIASQLTQPAGPGLRRIAAAIAILLLAASHTVPAHSVSGMETILYAFLLLLLFQLELSLHRSADPRVIRALPIVGLLVGLSRPEGVLASTMVLGAALWRSSPSVRRRLLRTTSIGFVAPGAIYFAWRFAYYGVPLPLTFYVTTLTHSGTTGLAKFQDFAAQVGVTSWLLFAVGAFACARRIPGSLTAIVTLTLFYIVPTHRIPHQSRYFFPALPLICAVVGCGVVVLARAVAARVGEGAARRAILIAVGVLAMLILVVNRANLGRDGITRSAAGLLYYTHSFEKRHVALGLELAEVSRGLAGRPSLAIGDAGAVPYYSGWHAIDSFGLNEPHIALTGDHDPQYILDQKPDLVIIRAWRGKPFKPMFAWGQAHYDACLAAGMEVIRIFGPAPYALVVMGDPQSEIARRLRRQAETRARPLARGVN